MIKSYQELLCFCCGCPASEWGGMMLLSHVMLLPIMTSPTSLCSLSSVVRWQRDNILWFTIKISFTHLLGDNTNPIIEITSCGGWSIFNLVISRGLAPLLQYDLLLLRKSSLKWVFPRVSTFHLPVNTNHTRDDTWTEKEDPALLHCCEASRQLE